MLTLPAEAFAAPANNLREAGKDAKAVKSTKPIDVQLTADGLLYGQVLDTQGKPIARTRVTLHGRGSKPVFAETNANGAFAYKGLGTGIIGLQAGGTARVCRVWSKKTAPPAATNAVLLVAESPTVRGQVQPPAYVNNAVVTGKSLFANPLVVAGVVATAVAVPVAIANDDDDAPSS